MDSKEYEEIIKKVEERVVQELKDKVTPDMLGYINVFDKRKKEILKNEYGIEWKTTQERNKWCNID